VQGAAVRAAQDHQAGGQLPARGDGEAGRREVFDGEAEGEDLRESKSFAAGHKVRDHGRMTYAALHHLIVEDRQRELKVRKNRRFAR
jgi:hypothetical protein